ncbi:20150_t:CDS:2 [Racocetra fulgida]|uniref:20150_t:CDS:1 n=1 Tax=Racocetra fulgida TaxID=60492 RepID=A0A9N9HWJ0_9GLOM|nr:20150_t:CDS:2 [Racocetra fulgida]
MAAAVVVSLGVSIVSLAVALGNNIVKQNQDKQNQEHVLIRIKNSCHWNFHIRIQSGGINDNIFNLRIGGIDLNDEFFRNL